MSAQVFLVYVALVLTLRLVQGDPVLFEVGVIKYRKGGLRHTFANVEHIDRTIVNTKRHLIIVKSTWMPVLHPEAVRNLASLEEITMVRCRIRQLEPRAFFNLPTLRALRLQDNHIEELRSGVFNGLPIRILSLQRNEIRTIDSGALDDMPNLFRIKLNMNKLKRWDAGWFRNSPQLTELYFRRNRLDQLPAYAFANIKGEHLVDGHVVADTKIFLSKNKLGRITPESFYGVKRLGQLYLDRNNITRIPAGAFRDLLEIDVVYLARNRIGEIHTDAFPTVRGIAILDLSSNSLGCPPWELVAVSNLTNLERNNDTCRCAEEYKERLLKQNINAEINYDKEDC